MYKKAYIFNLLQYVKDNATEKVLSSKCIEILKIITIQPVDSLFTDWLLPIPS